MSQHYNAIPMRYTKKYQSRPVKWLLTIEAAIPNPMTCDVGDDARWRRSRRL